MQSSLTEVENCFELLLPTLDNFFIGNDIGNTSSAITSCSSGSEIDKCEHCCEKVANEKFDSSTTSAVSTDVCEQCAFNRSSQNESKHS